MIIITIVTIISSAFILNKSTEWDNALKSNNQIDNIKSKKKVYKHTNPERISKNDYFKWEFISNDIASIYPRRDALVSDILVDIWDYVEVWDTLATLFNPWVNWEWQSKINLKNTITSSKNNLLVEVKNVKNAKIAELDQKIFEKQIILEETINNFDSKIFQIWDIDTQWSEYQVQLSWLVNLQKNLDNAEISKNQLLDDSNNNVNQKEQLLDSKIDDIYNKIIPILYIWNESEVDYKNINSYDFSDMFWAKDSESKNNLVSLLKIFHNEYSTLEIEKKYKKIIDINNLLIKVLHNTLISITTTEKTIQNHISNINEFNTSLISQQELLDDAKNMYKILEVSQNEKIENLETKISQKKNELSLLGSKSNSTLTEKTLAISKIKAAIETLKSSKILSIANENKAIVALQNEIAIAKADFNSEFIKSWDYKITSPFSGIISKRWFEVWEKVSPNMEIFRLSWVNTTLSKITKKEVKFYVPENIKDDLELGKQIRFNLWNDDNTTFTGTIYRISPEVDINNFSITVQAKVDENILLPNKSTLRVNLETKVETFKIPSSSVYNKEERKIIYYKKDNWKLWIRDINIVSDDWEYTLVTWNMDENLKIVTTPIFIK